MKQYSLYGRIREVIAIKVNGISSARRPIRNLTQGPIAWKVRSRRRENESDIEIGNIANLTPSRLRVCLYRSDLLSMFLSFSTKNFLLHPSGLSNDNFLCQHRKSSLARQLYKKEREGSRSAQRKLECEKFMLNYKSFLRKIFLSRKRKRIDRRRERKRASWRNQDASMERGKVVIFVLPKSFMQTGTNFLNSIEIFQLQFPRFFSGRLDW